MATLKDIAAHTGFSVAVVSRALNPHPDQRVAEPTRLAIEAACRKLGYRRNHAASCLRRGRHSAIGIFLPGLAGELTANLLRGLTRIANAYSFSCDISFGEDISEYLRFIEQANSLQRVGIISYAPICRRRQDDSILRTHMQRFISSGGKVLMINHEPASPLPGADCVCIDNYHGGRLAAEHLMAAGCRRFRLIASDSKYWQGARRNAGFLDTLAARRRPVEVFTVPGNDSHFTGMEKIVPSLAGETGIFTRSDYLALGLYRELRQAGRGNEPGGKLKIVSHDDLLCAAMLSPSLSSVRPPFEALGEIAMQTMLNRLINAGIDIDAACLKPQLIIRESSRPS